jgi:hypothetical protein
MIGDLEPVRDLPLKDARVALIHRGRIRRQLQCEHLLFLAAEQRQEAVNRLAQAQRAGETLRQAPALVGKTTNSIVRGSLRTRPLLPAPSLSISP